MRICPRCKTEKPLNEYYNRRNGIGNGVYCKPCTSEQTLERQREFKKLCVEYKGGKCCLCNYDTYIGALEFHHLDPKQKDFNVSKARFTKFDDRVTSELDKCILVCANCHREEHAKLNGTLSY